MDHGEFKNNDLDDERQPETAMWPPRPEVLISQKSMIVYGTSSNGKLGFQPHRDYDRV